MNSKVLVTRKLPLPVIERLKKRDRGVQKLRDYLNAWIKKLKMEIGRCEQVDVWESDDVIPRNELLKRVRGKEGVLCLLTDKIDKQVLESAGKQLRVLSTMSVGVDHIDVGECVARGVKLGHTPDILTSATAELTIGLLLATTRRIVEGTRAVKNGSWGAWKGWWMCGATLEGSTVGLFGLGRIGEAVVERLRPFGVKRFLYNTPRRKDTGYEKRIGASWVTFDDLLGSSDFVITCCALNRETSGIFDREAFCKMKSSAIFINVARGAVVRQEDLVEALRNGEIGAAGIDVTTPEPLPTDHPLLEMDNCVVTPHIGSATVATRNKMADLAVENLLAGLERRKMPAPYVT